MTRTKQHAVIPDFPTVIPAFPTVIPAFPTVIPDFPTVIPAKAGIQGFHAKTPWIPASAGMTARQEA